MLTYQIKEELHSNHPVLRILSRGEESDDDGCLKQDSHGPILSFLFVYDCRSKC